MAKINGQNSRNGLVHELQNIEIDCNYSSQRHFNTGAFFRGVHYSLGITAAVFSSLAAIAAFVGGSLIIIVSSLTIAATALVSILTFLSPGELSSQHYRAGNDYLSLRKDALYLLTKWDSVEHVDETKLESDANLIKEKLKCFVSTNGLLWTPRWAFNKARKDIQAGNTDYDYAHE